MPYPPYTITFKGNGTLRDPATGEAKANPFVTPGPHTLVWEGGTGKVTITLKHNNEDEDKKPTLVITFS
jgi:hypothetical protein